MAKTTIICEICHVQKEMTYQANRPRYCSTRCAKMRSANPMWKGGRSVDARGAIQIVTDTGHRYEHVVIAERALGKPLLSEHPVHHHDENPGNNTKSNLMICQDNAFHKLLHKRARVLRAGGDPNTQKVCSTCKATKNFTEFPKGGKGRDGLNSRCRICHRLGTQRYRDGKARTRREAPA